MIKEAIVKLVDKQDLSYNEAYAVINEIMALQHKEYKVYGVQFHPESIMTPEGRTILKNFLSL